MKSKVASWYSGIRITSPIAQGLGLFIVVLLLAVSFVPIVRLDAEQAADRKWGSEGVRIAAMAKEPESKIPCGTKTTCAVPAGEHLI